MPKGKRRLTEEFKIVDKRFKRGSVKPTEYRRPTDAGGTVVKATRLRLDE